MEAIIYLRVSTEEQAERGFSIHAQREECTKKAIELGCDIASIIEFSDEGISGSILERPALISALSLLKTDDEVKFFICLDSSRLSRNVSHQLIIVDEIKKSSTQLLFIKTSYDDTPEGRFQLTVMSAVDEYERARLRFRSELGKRAKASKHLLTHSPGLYGYDYNKDTDLLSINKEEAKNVRLMYRWAIEAEIGSNAIAQRLNDLGVPTKKNKLWQKTTVKRILSNTAYKGTLYIRRYDTADVKLNKYKEDADKAKRKERPQEEWIGVSVPIIIDEDTWNKVQDVASNARRKWRRYSKADYLLSALCRCGNCGSTMHGNMVSSKGKQRRYYVCTAKTPGIMGMDRCTLSFTNADMLEKLVWDKVVSWLKNPDELEKEIKSGLPDDIGEKEKRLSELDADISNLLKEKERVATMFQKGLIDELSTEKRLREINAKDNTFKQLQQSLCNEINAISISNKEPTGIKDIASKVVNILDRLSFEDRYSIVRSLVDEVIVTNETVIIKAKIPALVQNVDM
ncbi:MAG: recombinase family protein [Lutisporaceae bacterium]